MSPAPRPQAFHSADDGVLRSRLTPAAAAELAAVLRMLAPPPRRRRQQHQHQHNDSPLTYGATAGSRASSNSSAGCGGGDHAWGRALDSSCADGCAGCSLCDDGAGGAGGGGGGGWHLQALCIHNEAGSLMPPLAGADAEDEAAEVAGEEEEGEVAAGQELATGSPTRGPLALPLPAAAASAPPSGHARWLRLLLPLRLRAVDLYGVSLGAAELGALARLASVRVRGARQWGRPVHDTAAGGVVWELKAAGRVRVHAISAC